MNFFNLEMATGGRFKKNGNMHFNGIGIRTGATDSSITEPVTIKSLKTMTFSNKDTQIHLSGT